MDGRDFLFPFTVVNYGNRTGKRSTSTLVFIRYAMEINNNRKYCASVSDKADEAIEMG